MKFHEYNTCFQRSIKDGRVNPDTTLDQFKEIVHRSISEYHNPLEFSSFMDSIDIEEDWVANRRPYFRVWPVIIEPLTRVSLDIEASQIKILPIQSVSVHFPVGRELIVSDDQSTSTALVTSILVSTIPIDGGFNMSVSVKYTKDGEDDEVFSYASDFKGIINDSLEKIIESDMKFIGQNDHGIFRAGVASIVAEDVTKIAIGIMLMAQDPELVIPDVLNKDKDKFEDTGSAKFIERAHKRGKIGWNVGQKMQEDLERETAQAEREGREVSTHIRRPHFAIRWCGKGGSDPRLRPVKGSIVNKKKLTEVPTGYLDDLVS